MLFSKSAVTLFSTIGASSIPVISVVALYQIKHFSLGNNLDSSSASNSSEEGVISLPEVKQPKVPEPAAEPPAQTPQAQPKPQAKEEKESTPTIKPKGDTEQKKSPQTPNTPSSAIITKDTIKPDSEASEIVVDPQINSAQDLTELAKKLLDSFVNGAKQAPNDSDIVKDIDNLSAFLQKKSSSIADENEKNIAKEIIESLNKLKSKISTKK